MENKREFTQYSNPIDDMPIKAVGSKTFEQLIEEKLKESLEQGQEVIA